MNFTAGPTFFSNERSRKIVTRISILWYAYSGRTPGIIQPLKWMCLILNLFIPRMIEHD